MRMRNCPHCGNGVQETATKCPHCGGSVSFMPTKSEQQQQQVPKSAQNVSGETSKGVIILGVIIAICAFMFIKSMIAGDAELNSARRHSDSYPKTLYGLKRKTVLKDIVKGADMLVETQPLFNSEKNIAWVMSLKKTGCPFTDAFSDVYKSESSKPENKDYFIFYRIEGSNLTPADGYSYSELRRGVSSFQKFLKDYCVGFCIINPKTGEVYSMEGPSFYKEVYKNPEVLNEVLTTLKDW